MKSDEKKKKKKKTVLLKQIWTAYTICNCDYFDDSFLS